MQIGGLCLLATLLTVLLKRTAPETSFLLTIAVCLAVCLFLGHFAGELYRGFVILARESELDAALFVPLFKTAGIAIVVKLGGSLCRDAGDSAMAVLLETAGAVCALVVAIPLLQAVLELLRGLMT